MRPTPSLHHSCVFLGKQQLMEHCLTWSSQPDADRYLHRGSDQTSALLATSRQPPRPSCLTFANQYLILTWLGHQVLSREPEYPGKQTGFMSDSFLSGSSPHQIPCANRKAVSKVLSIHSYLNENIYYILAIVLGVIPAFSIREDFPIFFPIPSRSFCHLFHSVQEILSIYSVPGTMVEYTK